MSPRVPYRVTLWMGRELSTNIEASNPDVAEEIATYILEHLGSRAFESTGEQLIHCIVEREAQS